MLILNKIFSVVSQQHHIHYQPSCTYYVTCVPSLYTHPEYRDTAHNMWWTNWFRQPSCFLVSSPLDISNFTFTLPLVLVNLRVHTYFVRSARYSRILSSAWSACLRSLRAPRGFCLIYTLFSPNTWLTASTTLCLLPCQFLLHLFLATFLCCCFCASFSMLQCQMPVLACCLNSLVLSCLFLIMFSCSSRRSSWCSPCLHYLINKLWSQSSTASVTIWSCLLALTVVSMVVLPIVSSHSVVTVVSMFNLPIISCHFLVTAVSMVILRDRAPLRSI